MRIKLREYVVESKVMVLETGSITPQVTAGMHNEVMVAVGFFKHLDSCFGEIGCSKI